jgi:long-chain fatty acid transport protein
MPTRVTLLRRVLVALGLGVGLTPLPASAAGFALFEQGARGLGFAGAYTAQASDPSAIFHNAAGLAFLNGTQVYAGATLVAPRFEFTGAAPFPGPDVTEESKSVYAYPPSFYLTHTFDGGFAVGVGVNVPFGLQSTWENPDRYSGRYISTNAELKGFSVNPTLAYRLSDKVAIGAGLDIRLSSVVLERRVPVINPFTQAPFDAAAVVLESDTATGYGFNVGLLAKLTDSLSFGASYRHKVAVDFEGDATFELLPSGNAQLDQRVAALIPQGALPVTTRIEFPAIASVGLANRWDRWTAEVDVNWYGWSSFDRLPLTFVDRPALSEEVVEDYEDAFQVRVGVERLLGEAWAVRVGYFFDQSPAPAASVSPLLPDADRHGIALGLGWNPPGPFHADVGTWIIRSPERSTEGVNRDAYDGVYKSRALTIGLSVGYQF